MKARLEDFQVLPMKDFADFNLELARGGFRAFRRNDIPVTPFSSNFDWHDDPYQDRNWMFQLHAWRMLDGYLNAIHQRDDTDNALQKTFAIIQDWHRGNVKNGEGKWSWYDMSTGIRASKLAFLAHTLRNLGRNIEDIETIPDLVTLHLEKLSDPDELNSGNHGLFQLWGLKSLAAAFPDHPLSEAARSYAIGGMVDLATRQMGEHGVHTENSPAYHFFAMSRLGIILDAPDWKIPELSFIRKKLRAGEKVMPWLFDPTNRIVPVGDSDASRAKQKRSAHLRDWPHQGQGDLMGAILDGYTIVRTRPAIPLEQSSHLFLTASFHSQTHKHADCLSFVWQEKGEQILIDSGRYGYTKGDFRNYFLSTRAHNTVEVNGKSFNRKIDDVYGSGIRTQKILPDGRWIISAEAPHRSDGYNHRRTLVFLPGKQLHVFDSIAPEESLKSRENTYCVWWHFPTHIEVEAGEQGAQLSGFSTLNAVSLTHFSNAGTLETHIHRGEKEPRYQGWVSTGYLKAEPAPALGFSGKASDRFVAATVFEVNANPKRNLDSIRWEALEQLKHVDWEASEIDALEKAITGS